MMPLRNSLIIVFLFCGLLQSTVGQISVSPTNSFSNSYSPSFTNTNSYTPSFTNSFSTSYTNSFSTSYTNSFSNSFSTSYTNSYTNTNSYTPSFTNSYTTSYTNSFTITTSFSNSFTNSFTPSFSPTFSTTLLPSILPRPTLRSVSSNTNCFTVAFQQVLGATYPTYGLKVIQNDNLFIKDYILPLTSFPAVTSIIAGIPTTEFYFTLCNFNESNLLPSKTYSVQAYGVTAAGVIGPLSFPVTTGLTLLTYLGPTVSDVNSISGLTCYYGHPYITCNWNNGNRAWFNATLQFNCTRTTLLAGTAYQAEEYVLAVLKNQNTFGGGLPTSASLYLPSGCACVGSLTSYYNSPTVFVQLNIISPTAFVDTTQPAAIANTPTVDIF